MGLEERDRQTETAREGGGESYKAGWRDRQVNIDSFYRRCLSLEGTQCKRPRIARRA